MRIFIACFAVFYIQKSERLKIIFLVALYIKCISCVSVLVVICQTSRKDVFSPLRSMMCIRSFLSFRVCGLSHLPVLFCVH